MPVPSTISDLSTTPSSNGPDGATEAGSVLDDYARAHASLIRGIVSAGADIASASTITPPATGESFNLTGTTTVTTIASTNSWDGRIVWFRHTGAHSFTNSGTLVCLGGANITFASGDISAWRQRTSGTWDQVLMQRADGALLGDSWNVDTSGRLLNNGATQPRFLATSSAIRSTTGIFDTYTETYDIGSWFDASTGVATVPVSGTYIFVFYGYMNPTGSTSDVTISVWDGTNSITAWYEETISSEKESTVTALKYLSAGATISARLVNGGANLSGARAWSFAGSLIC